MKTFHKVIIGFLVLAGSIVSIGGFIYTSRIASAYNLGTIIIEPAEPNPKPEKLVVPVDERIKKLKDRGDGARLVAVPKKGETFLRLAFSDNAMLIVSATTTIEDSDEHQIFRLSLKGKRTKFAESKKYLSTSSHRPQHPNVGTTCFSQKDENNVIDIWCQKRGEDEAMHLTEHDGREAIKESAISPGGDWVAFQVDDLSRKDPEGSTVWKIGMNRSGIQQLTRGADDRYPTWSLDGKSLYFQRRLSDGNWDIYRMTEGGANPEPILRTYNDDEMWPTEISKDRLVLSSGPRGEAKRLRVLEVDSKLSTWITSGAYGSEISPSVSPDGKLVTFLAPVDSSEPERLGIWVAEIRE